MVARCLRPKRRAVLLQFANTTIHRHPAMRERASHDEIGKPRTLFFVLFK